MFCLQIYTMGTTVENTFAWKKGFYLISIIWTLFFIYWESRVLHNIPRITLTKKVVFEKKSQLPPRLSKKTTVSYSCVAWRQVALTKQNRDGWLPSPSIDSLLGTFAARREHYRFLVMSGITLCWVALDTWADIFLGYLFGCSFSEHLDAID